MSEAINIFSIEEAEPESRSDWTSPGHELYVRPSRWLKTSEYYRLIERERRAPLVLTLRLCAVLAGLCGTAYLFSR